MIDNIEQTYEALADTTKRFLRHICDRKDLAVGMEYDYRTIGYGASIHATAAEDMVERGWADAHETPAGKRQWIVLNEDGVALAEYALGLYRLHQEKVRISSVRDGKVQYLNDCRVGFFRELESLSDETLERIYTEVSDFCEGIATREGFKKS